MVDVDNPITSGTSYRFHNKTIKEAHYAAKAEVIRLICQFEDMRRGNLVPEGQRVRESRKRRDWRDSDHLSWRDVHRTAMDIPEYMPDEGTSLAADPQTSTEGSPEAVKPQTSAEIKVIEEKNAVESLRGRLRGIFAVALIVLLAGDVALYSLYQAEHSRVDTLDHRIERMDKMLIDLIAAEGNAERVVAIEQKVTGMESQMVDLVTTLREEDAKALAEAIEPSKKKQK